MMNDQEFEDQAAIQILAGMFARENFHSLEPSTVKNANVAGYAEKAYIYARALVTERKKRKP